MINEAKAVYRAQYLLERHARGEYLRGEDLKRFRRYVDVATLAIVRFGLKQADAERFAAIEACGVDE